MKLQILTALMLALLSQTASAQDVGPISVPALKDTTGQQPPLLPHVPQEEPPNPDQPPILVCTRPLGLINRKKTIQVLVADREMKAVAVTDQAKGAIEYHRSRKIAQFAKAADCLEFALVGTTLSGDESNATLEMDLARGTAAFNDGSATGPVVYPTCRVFQKGDYLKVGAWIRNQL